MFHFCTMAYLWLRPIQGLSQAPMQEAWMSGEVWDVLPHGLRLRKLSETWEDKFYIIPTGHVPLSLLARLATGEPDPSLPSHLPSAGVHGRCRQVRVKFQAAQRPGADEASGEERAKAVELSTDASEPHGVPSDTFEQFPPALPPCPAMTAFAEEWQLRAGADVESVKQCLNELQESYEHGRLTSDGSRICEVFSCCLAGVHVMLDCHAWSAKFSGGPHQTPNVELQTAFACLLTTCLCWLSAQDFGQVLSIKPALCLCRELSRLFLANPWPAALKSAWRDICQSSTELYKLVSQGRPRKLNIPTLKRTKVQCSVAGCMKINRRGFRDVAWRCKAHQPKRLCNVVGCNRSRVAKVYQADIFGPAGTRCCVHSARECNVLNCKRFAKCQTLEADQFPGLHLLEATFLFAPDSHVPTKNIPHSSTFNILGRRCFICARHPPNPSKSRSLSFFIVFYRFFFPSPSPHHNINYR